ncbi:hypothetical protein [Neptuniibacter sp.]|uniref:hypothetical protein n=1 Tax=Neptuniibacter sp. TaxID=1962643 RepID=UPI002607AE64|nr:hypothetical protein [Neptuniibacter sp.]MCP4595428.1 hypothetical protein [Neptuniibacter sp.]
MKQSDHGLIMFALGLAPIPEELDKLLSNGSVKLLDELYDQFTAHHFSQLPTLNLHTDRINVEGRWHEQDGYYAVGDDEYADKLYEAIMSIYPEPSPLADKVPVTILLPSAIKQDEFKLTDSPSEWEFITLKEEDKQDDKSYQLGLQGLRDELDMAYPLRLFLAFKFLGLVDTLKPANNNSRIVTDLLESLSMSGQFDFLDHKKLTEWSKQYKEHCRISSRIDTLQEKDSELYKLITSGTPGQIKKTREKRNQVQSDIANLKEKLSDIDISPLQATPSPETKSYYFAIPKELRVELELPEDKPYCFPTLKIKSKPKLKYTTVCVDSAKPTDRHRAKRSTDKLRFMLCYLCSMTSGTAITFYVDKAKYQSVTGKNSPTLILPDSWAKLALGLKQYENAGTPSMSDDDYASDNLKKDYIAAIYGSYISKQGELLRLIPTVWGPQPKEF